jgi:signal transduction histidine kinase/PAS domain-containing protein
MDAATEIDNQTAQREVERSIDSDLLFSIVERAPMAIVVIEGLSGRIKWAGGAYERITGYATDESLGTNFLDQLDPRWRAAASDSFVYALANNARQRPNLLRLLRRDGEPYVAEVVADPQLRNPAVKGLCVYIRRWDWHLMDGVLECLASGAPIEETLDLLAQLISGDVLESEGVVFWEPHAGHFERSVATIGLPPSLATDTAPEAPWGTCARTGQPGWFKVSELSPSFRDRAEDAGYSHCWCWPVSIGVKVAGCVVVWRRNGDQPDRASKTAVENIVRVMRLIFQREEAQRRLQVQQRLAAVGTLTAGVAHEIRNPLNFVMNFAQLGQESLEELRRLADEDTSGTSDREDRIAELGEELSFIQTHANRIDSIVSSMLGLSSNRAAERYRTDVVRLLRTSVKFGYEGYRGTGHSEFKADLTWDAPESLNAEVYADELGRAIINLVTNACASMHEKSRQVVGFKPDLHVRVREEADEVIISVSDNGLGIPEDRRARLFEPFFTTKQSGEGVGLGLSVCHEVVVVLHGGAIRLDSVEGNFARFDLLLPRRAPVGGPGPEDP